jgi:hypothetical protein
VASNADAIVLQWANLHGLPTQPSRSDRVEGYPRQTWLGPDGSTLIEHYEITGMAHGIPLEPGTGEGQSGEAGAHMLDVGLSSTDRIAEFFGIAPAEVARKTTARAADQIVEAPRRKEAKPDQPKAPLGGVGADVQGVIEKALKAAGLMR